MYSLLRAEIEKQKQLRKLTNQNLSEMTGYAKRTIDIFMCNGSGSDKLANTLARVLGIER